MGLLDPPAASPVKLRIANLYGRLASATTLPIPGQAPTVDIPTVTTGTTATLTGQLIGPQTGIATEIGSRGTWNSGSGRLVSVGVTGFDFYLTGSSIEFQIFPNFSGSCPIWIWVNGLPATLTPDNVTVVSNNYLFIKLAFPSSARRRIEFFCLHGSSWYSIRADTTSLIVPAPRKPVVGFVGDSFWGGSAGTPTLQCGHFLMSRMLGVECFSQSIGGTGYVNNGGSGNTFGSTARVAAVAAGNPELIIMQGSLNDDGQTGIQAAATAAYAALATACPKAKIIVFGPQPNNANSTLSANRAANIAAVKAAALAAPNVLAFHDLVGSAGGTPATATTYTTYNDGDLRGYLGSVWKVSNGGAAWASGPSTPGTTAQWALQTVGYTGTGNTGNVVGDGTRDTYLYSDGVHPMPDGSAALAVTEANLIRADLAAASA